MSNHKQIKKLTTFSMVVLIAATLLIVGAISVASAQQTATRLDLPAVNAALYETETPPLTVDQCGQCHFRPFGDLKQAGGKHRFDCRECHETFHAYNPKKKNYAEIMPKCATCHGQPHGEKHFDCFNCHENPHAPTQVPMTHMLAGICADCHNAEATELQQFPSKHTEQACNSCHHNRHGYIPACAECHEPHFATQAEATCMQCHPVHQPLTIALSTEVELETCNACHPNIYEKWQGTPSKHGQVGCAECHTEHAMIPECSNCHTPPESHAAKLLEMFPNCLTCHLDVHDLPVKTRK